MSRAMSALGQKQTSRHARVMSVLPLKADIRQREWHVRLVPIADVRAISEEASELLPTFNRKTRQGVCYDRPACRNSREDNDRDKVTSGAWVMKTIALQDAVAKIPDGASLMIGGFMAVGTPERLIDELVRQGKRNLTVIANDTAMPGKGIGKLLSAGLISRVIASHIGLNPETQQQMIAGKIDVDLVPQGTLIERIRAGGFGLGGILTPTGVGTVVEEGKRRIELDGKDYLLETALRADFALVHSFLADYLGNLSYALTARNFNPVVAMAADTVIVTAEHIVPVGVIAPDHVVTPAPVVDYLVANE